VDGFARAQQEYENRTPAEPDFIGPMLMKCVQDEAILTAMGMDGKMYPDTLCDCPFEGIVEVIISRNEAQWDCPCCGYANTSNVTGWNEEDPDDARDRWLDR
jgi:hypothetical protein